MNDSQTYVASYHLLGHIPSRWWCNEPFPLAILLRNDGIMPWVSVGAQTFRLSCRWQNFESERWHAGESPLLPAIVRPGATYTFPLTLTPPPEPGTYTLLISLREDDGTGAYTYHATAPLTMITIERGSQPLVSLILPGGIAALSNLIDANREHILAQMRALRATGYHVSCWEPGESPAPTLTPRLCILPYSGDSPLCSEDHEIERLISSIPNALIIIDYFDERPSSSPPHSHIHHADYILTRNHVVRQHLIDTGVTTADRIIVIPPGTLHPLHPLGEESFALPTHLHSKHILLHAGALTDPVSLMRLIDMLPHIHTHHPNAILILLHDQRYGPMPTSCRTAIEAYIDEHGYSDHVFIEVPSTIAEARGWHKYAKLFLAIDTPAPATRPIVEAMQHRLPVLAESAPHIDELVDTVGIVVSPRAPQTYAAHVCQLLAEPPPAYAPPTDDEYAALRRRTIILVSPRYGEQILGGAERHIRAWAEQLARRGYRIEVLTTCTVHIDDWGNHRAPGIEHLNGVTVRYFPIDSVDRRVFEVAHAKVLSGAPMTLGDELDIMAHNLQSSALNRHLAHHAQEYAAVIFSPYLFGTTFWGMQMVPGKALILPCIHDESSVRLHLFRDMLERMDGILFSTQPESDFATQVLKVTNPRRMLVAYGFDRDHPPGDAAAFRARYHLPNQIILSSGRLVEHKNIHLLIDYFVRYKEQFPSEMALVLTGAGDVPIPKRPDIVATGMLPEEMLPHAFAAATVFCLPSTQESFSIVIMEAWLQKRPVLVHADCAVTHTHVRASAGGRAFASFEQFCEALEYYRHDPAAADAAGARGHAYVQQHYLWDAVIDRLLHGIIAFTRPYPLSERLAQQSRLRGLALGATRFAHAATTALDQIRLSHA